MIRLGGDAEPRRLLAAALEWSAERIGVAAGGCALFSPRHEPIASAWGSAHAERADHFARVAERAQLCLFPAERTSALARRADADPAQLPVLALAHEELGRCGELLAEQRLAAPLLVAVLRADGRVAGLVWLAADGGGRRASRGAADGPRALRRVQRLLELALRDRWYHLGPWAVIGADLAERALTPRQEAIARLAVAGLGNGEIAARLGVSERTVKNQMTRVLARCGVRTRTQLIALYGSGGRGESGTLG